MRLKVLHKPDLAVQVSRVHIEPASSLHIHQQPAAHMEVILQLTLEPNHRGVFLVQP